MEKRLTWDEGFMLTAILWATRTSCLKRGVGAVVVKDNRIVGTGYNGAASGITSSRELGDCYYENLAYQEFKQSGGDFAAIKERFKIHCLAVHAEANALSQVSKEDSIGSTLYITNYPCTRCVNDVIITRKVKTVRVWKQYLSDPTLSVDEKRASEHNLLQAGVSVSYIKITDERIQETMHGMCKVGERTDYVFKPGGGTL